MSRDDPGRHDALPTKVAGRRRWGRGLSASAPLLQLALELRGRKPFLPRGVYRFRTFEESDELILRMLTRLRKPGPRSQQTGLGQMDTLADGRAFDTTEIKRKIGASEPSPPPEQGQQGHRRLTWRHAGPNMRAELPMVEVAPRIVVDEKVRFGRPVIAGTRVPVEVVVGKLGAGMSVDEVADQYGIEAEDVRAALRYAATVVESEQVRAVS